MSIEIVTHVWAERFPLFANALRYHLTGPIRHPPSVPVTFKICYTPSDSQVIAVLDEFADYNSPAYKIVRLPLPLDLLGRRHYGRDLAAAESRADLVWFADVDYYAGPGCLDTVYREWEREKAAMLWPDSCLISCTHVLGDSQIAEAVSGLSPTPVASEFKHNRYSKAIGGTFFIDGDYARDVGYLRGEQPPWKKPMRPFEDTPCDVRFRKQVQNGGVKMRAITIPNFYRLRHCESAIVTHKVTT